MPGYQGIQCRLPILLGLLLGREFDELLSPQAR